jgi:hypothetical protein
VLHLQHLLPQLGKRSLGKWHLGKHNLGSENFGSLGMQNRFFSQQTVRLSQQPAGAAQLGPLGAQAGLQGAAQLADLGAQAGAQGAAQLLDFGAQAGAQGAAQLLALGAQAGAQGAAQLLALGAHAGAHGAAQLLAFGAQAGAQGAAQLAHLGAQAGLHGAAHVGGQHFLAAGAQHDGLKWLNNPAFALETLATTTINAVVRVVHFIPGFSSKPETKQMVNHSSCDLSGLHDAKNGVSAFRKRQF